MRIGFDAKRMYQNSTGLGNYSRTLVDALAALYPDNEYHLYAPKITSLFEASKYTNVKVHSPEHMLSKMFKAIWRSSWVKQDLIKDKIDIYHGLSHEIPQGIQHKQIKSVVTIHDLIFEKYPEQFATIDRLIYRHKFRNACIHADRIITVSDQTKQDIIELYRIPEQKIITCYQTCNEIFFQPQPDEIKTSVRERYALPDEYFLYVGSVIERKNLLRICKAYQLDKEKTCPPLVIIGSGGQYLKLVKTFIQEHQLTDRFIFLSEQEEAGRTINFNYGKDLPAIYQLSKALIYPSIYEGFGIPLLEAMASGTPVITSNISCLPEVGGAAASYVNPFQEMEIYEAMKALLNDAQLRKKMIEAGKIQAAVFSKEKCTENVMKVYQSLMP